MLELYEHNLQAYEAAKEQMARTGKAAVIHPTGTGKSIIAFKLVEDHPDARVCWLSPSNYIVRTQRENVCRLDPNFADDHVQYYTYARLMNMAYTELAAIRPAYIILDEFHRCGAAEWGRGVQALLQMYPDVPILGLSATNIRYLDHQRDMAVELFGGNIASEMSVAEAIATGILPTPTYVIALYAYQKELEKYERRVNSIRHRSNFDKNCQYLEALRRALELSVGLDAVFQKHMKDKSGKYILFCSGKEHMDTVRGQIPEWFAGVDRQPHIYSVLSEEPDSEQSFQAFKSDTSGHLKLLLCIDMLSEGIHVEDISGVILLRPTTSPIVYKQQIGRALAAGKNTNPLIFDIVNNFDSLSSASYLQEEMQSVSALYRERGEGERIVEESFRVIDEVRACRSLLNQLEESLSITWDVNYQAAKVYHQQHGNLNVPVGYRTDKGIQLGTWISYQRKLYSGRYHGSLTPERIEKLNRLGMIWENRYEHHWEFVYQIAEEYYISNGNLRVPSSYVTEEGVLLGRWLRRQADNRDNLPEDKVSRLDAIGMNWTNSWESRYETALAFLLENPGYILTQTTVINNFWVGKWLVQQLRSYEKDVLNQRQKQLMEEMIRQTGIDIQTKGQRQWNSQLARLKDLTEKYGGWERIPVMPENKAVLRWLRTQRQRQEAGQLPQNQVEQLLLLGICPERKTDPWMEFYRKAETYYRENAHLQVPAAYVTADGVRLGAWICKQRNIRRNPPVGGGLSQHQICLLDAIGMEWDPHRKAFEKGVEAAQRYFAENGHLRVPTGYVDAVGFPLFRWLSDVRRKKENLLQEDIQRLDAMGFIWKKHGATPKRVREGSALMRDHATGDSSGAP